MVRAQSPGYPNMSLPKAIQSIKKVHEADRRNPIAREVAVKHMGYSGPSGAADKSLASLIHYGLMERYGKGEVRVSALAVDILHPPKPEDRARALVEAAFNPSIFADLKERFGSHVSEEALRSYLVREDFLDRAISPVVHGYLETCRYLEQEKAYESGGAQAPLAPESDDEDGDTTVFGGAKLGDLVQWEVNGALMMEGPMRVRLVTEDGKWVAVEGSETGIPMDQVIVQERAAAPAGSPPPTFKINTPAPDKSPATALVAGETEWIRNRVGRETSVRLLVSGKMGAKEIGKLITLLEAQRAVLDDDEEASLDKEADNADLAIKGRNVFG